MTTPPDLPFQSFGTGPPILIIHGWTMSPTAEAADLEPIFTSLPSTSPTHRRIYPLLPAHALSPTTTIQSLTDILLHLASFIETHILPSRFLLIGTSCGGYLARALAHRFAAHVDGLFLRVPVTEPHSPNRDVDPFAPAVVGDLSWLPDAERDALGDISVQTRAYVAALREKVKLWDEESVKADGVVLGRIRGDPARYRLTARMHTREEPFGKPTLIVAGRVDADVGFRDAFGILEAYPRATYVVLDRAGHGLPVDEMEVEVLRALVGDWLRRVEETQGMAHAGGKII
ncbi:Alpha/Beta hydrolase protein [Elsinoe ampelina]|uniref:Alpha/Beta hydrolase protein n=1 Tax=Elsinoe ampelina TaxID=302913 RepID=A0A6A6GKC4_9PEZI|nr:Alpha/Beta hydrolase protein [Elsinoe ampelina]